VTTSGKSDPAPVKAPTSVNVAFWLAIVGLSIIVLNAVLVLTLKEQSITYELGRRAPDSTVTPEQIRDAINLGVWINFGVSVVFGLLGAYFARKLKDGERPARTRFTIVGVVLILCLFFVGNFIALGGLIFVMIAMAVAFSGSVTRYLTEQ
jgi:hypothetical protein